MGNDYACPLTRRQSLRVYCDQFDTLLWKLAGGTL
jgi:hypothetical protein